MGEEFSLDKHFSDLNRQDIAAMETAFSDALIDIGDELRRFSFWKIGTWKWVFLALYHLVCVVEEIGGEGSLKRQLAIGYLNSRVNLPLLNESMESGLFGALVDSFVFFLNRKFGHNWLTVFQVASMLKNVGRTLGDFKWDIQDTAEVPVAEEGDEGTDPGNIVSIDDADEKEDSKP